MKKLLFLTAAIGFAFSLNAQQIDTRKTELAPVYAPMQSMEKIEKMDAQLAKPSSFLNANTIKGNSAQKSTNAEPVYTSLGFLYNAYFSRLDDSGIKTGERDDISYATTLFPDSLAFPFTAFVDGTYVDSNYKGTTFPATGFVFDPYSLSYTAYRTHNLFSHKDTLYGYKLDTIQVLGDYRVVTDITSSPDTLRFYACTHDIYYPGTDFRKEYFALYWESLDHRNALAPIVNFANPIPQKGNAVTPKAYDNGNNGVTWDYILGLNDTTGMISPGYVRGRYITTEIGGFGTGGIEVPPGSAVSIMMKFIPGYDYDLNDTISITYRNYSQQSVISEDIRMNRFMPRYWNVEKEETRITLMDLQGYNSFLMEDQRLRYKHDSLQRFNDANSVLQSFYNPGYGAKTAFWFKLSQGDNYVVVDTSSITEHGELISAIYPNPATSQLTIDLKEEGKADVAIYNILGQALIQESVYDMSNTINISDLSQGMYIVRVTQNGKIHTVRFSKQ